MLSRIFRTVISIVLCFTIVVSCATVFNAAENSEEIKNVDIVFCIDTTGNSVNVIDSIKSTLKDILNNLDMTNRDCRFAFIQYRDFTQKTSSFDFSFEVKDFSSDLDEINNYIDSITLSYYSNEKNCLFSSLIDGHKELSFREDSVKAYIVMGQSECYDPEPFTGYDFTDIINEFNMSVNGITSICKYKFFTINFGTNANVEKYYKYFSDYSGGKYYSVSSEDESFKNSFSAILKEILNEVFDNLEYAPDDTKISIGEVVDNILSSTPEFLKELLEPVVRIIVMLILFFNI